MVLTLGQSQQYYSIFSSNFSLPIYKLWLINCHVCNRLCKCRYDAIVHILVLFYKQNTGTWCLQHPMQTFTREFGRILKFQIFPNSGGHFWTKTTRKTGNCNQMSFQGFEETYRYERDTCRDMRISANLGVCCVFILYLQSDFFLNKPYLRHHLHQPHRLSLVDPSTSYFLRVVHELIYP